MSTINLSVRLFHLCCSIVGELFLCPWSCLNISLICFVLCIWASFSFSFAAPLSLELFDYSAIFSFACLELFDYFPMLLLCVWSSLTFFLGCSIFCLCGLFDCFPMLLLSVSVELFDFFLCCSIFFSFCVFSYVAPLCLWSCLTIQ